MDYRTGLTGQMGTSLRTLNHATADDLNSLAGIYLTLAGLKAMAQQLPPLFGQLSRWLNRERDAGRVAHESSTHADACEAVDGVIDALNRASADAALLAEALSTAH